MIYANLLHLSYNMWSDRQPPPELDRNRYWVYQPDFCFDESLWNDLLRKMADAGMNMVVIDVGDGVKYSSHPRISVRGAWTPARLKEELAKARSMGIEPIPKLNFSATHDAWMGEYARCVSSKIYYPVCSDLIAEVIDLFSRPRFFHLGMDEETAAHQRYHAYVVVRQFELWWHDLLFLVGEVEKGGSRPWVWSDYLWNHAEEFFDKMPKSVLQSNWYYGADFGMDNAKVRAYVDLDARGYDQVPTCSNHALDENCLKTFEYCTKHVAPERLLGFLQSIWRPTKEEFRERHMRAIELMGQAIARQSGSL